MKWLGAYAALLLAILALPIPVVVVASLTTGERMAFPQEDLSLRWYATFLQSPEFREFALTSLQVAVLTSLCAGAIGTLAAVALARGRFAGDRVAEAVLTLPLAIPSVVLALAFLILHTRFGIAGSKAAQVAGHTVMTLPFVLRLVRANFAGYAWSVERAAANLGASPAQAFRHVTLPLVRRGVVGGAIFAFVLSFDEVVIALFLPDPDAVTLPVRIFTYLDQSPSPIVLAAGSVLVIFAAVTLLVLERPVRIGRAFGVQEG